MNNKNHRLSTYAAETRADMPNTAPRAKKAAWLSLNLPRSIQATILKLQILASDLPTHASERTRRKVNDYAESPCPVCSRTIPRPPEADMYETIHHLTQVCPQLKAEQDTLSATAAAELLHLGGQYAHGTPRQLTWQALPSNTQIALLLGNPSPTLTAAISNSFTRHQWHTEFLIATTPNIRALLHRRRDLIRELYPEL